MLTQFGQVVKALVLEVCSLQGLRFNTSWVQTIPWGHNPIDVIMKENLYGINIFYAYIQKCVNHVNLFVIFIKQVQMGYVYINPT
jgi:hypothetical protein